MADAIAPPKNRRELSTRVNQLGTVEVQIAKRSAQFDAEYDKLLAKHAKAADDLLARHGELASVISTYAEENRSRLVEAGSKTIKLAQGGTISWRLGKQKAVIQRGLDEQIMKFLRRRGWVQRFTKPQPRKLAKELLVKDPERAKKIPGVYITQEEALTIDTGRPSIVVTHVKENPYKLIKKDD